MNANNCFSSSVNYRLLNFKTAGPIVLVIGLLAVSFPRRISAVVLVTYDIAAANAGTDSTLTPSATAGITASDLSLTGVTTVSAAGTYLATDWETSASSPDLAKYMEFTVTPTGGNQITFATLTGSAWRAAGNPVGVVHGADTFQLRSSADSFGSTIGGTLDLSLTGDAEQIPFSFDLSSLGTRTGSTTFRLYAYNQANAFGAGLANNNGAYDGTGSDLALNGSVSPVPEPRIMTGIVALALVCFATLKRTVFPPK